MDQETMDGSPALVESAYYRIKFQCGVIPEVKVNGCTIRDIIQVLIDRLKGFQAGPFACRENNIALGKLQEAKMWLEARQADRVKRGVEGKHVV